MRDKNLLLKNGRIIDPVNNLDQQADIFLVDGLVKEVVPAGQGNFPVELQTIDVGGRWVVPGLIDMHVHLREPGEEYKETIGSGTRAAAAGGFTAVACMPNTNPVNDCQAVTCLVLEKARDASARVYPIGAISRNSAGTQLSEFNDLKRAGAVALSDDGRPVVDSQLMRRALEYSANHDLLLISHAEELSLSARGVMNESALSTRLGLRGIPHVAEEIMIYRDIALAHYCRRPIHIAHISTRESVSLIRRAKEMGWPVTAETAPHYFSLTEDAVGQYDTRAKMNPPLRGPDDVQAIKDGLKDGTIDAIATDHAPHSTLEKDVEFDLAANGIIGLETSVPLALALVRDGVLTPGRMIALMSVNPARILGVSGGALTPGMPADVTIIDPDKEFVYRREEIVSKSENSPFIDWKLRGRAVMTIVGGRVMFKEL